MKSNQGFASEKYNKEIKFAAQSKGGKAKVPKGFAMMTPEKFITVREKRYKKKI